MKTYSVMHEREEHNFTLNKDELSNCAYRLGTDALVSEHSN